MARTFAAVAIVATIVLAACTGAKPSTTPIASSTSKSVATLTPRATGASARNTASSGTLTSGSNPTDTSTPPASGAAMVLDAPTSATGRFDVKVNIVGATPQFQSILLPYVGFNLQLTFDSAALAVESVDYGGVLGPRSGAFCVTPIKNDQGQALAGCSLLERGTSVLNPGTAAVFHLRVLKAASVKLHITTFDEGGSATGAYVLAPTGAIPSPAAVATQDATVAARP